MYVNPYNASRNAPRLYINTQGEDGLGAANKVCGGVVERLCHCD